MKNSSAGRALDLKKDYPPSDHASSQYRSGPSRGGSDSRLLARAIQVLGYPFTRADFDMAASDAIVRVCLGLGKFRPKNVDELVSAVGMELTGVFFYVHRGSPLYKLIESRVERLVRAGVIVERDGGIVVGQEDERA